MNYIHDYHHQWLALLVLSLLFFSAYFVKPNFGMAAAAFFFSCCLSALYVWVYRDNRYVTVEPYDQMALRYFAADSLGKMLIVIVPLMVMAQKKERFYELGVFLVALFACVNTAAILIKFFFWGCKTGHACGGIVGNPSISVSLLVCTLPIFIRSRAQWPIVAAAALAVFVSRSSIGIGLLAAYACLWFFPWGMGLKKISASLAGLTFAVSGLFSLAYLYVGPDFFHTSDRWRIWTFMMERWSAPANIPMGTGLGTYHVFSINLQKYGHVAEKMHWNWLHNNWLTFLFEMGVVGLLLSLIVYTVALRRMILSREKGVAVAIALYGLFMCMNPALNVAWPALFGAWLFLYALSRDSLQYPSVTS